MRKHRNIGKMYIPIYVTFLVFYLWLAAQVPYTHDDWDWGSSNGIEQLLHATVNARYTGNFFAVVMTRSHLLKTLIMGAGYFFIPYGLAVYASQGLTERLQERRLSAFLLCNLMFLLLPREIWRQTYGWVAGFANYSVSAVFLLVWIREIRLAFLQESANRSAGVWELLLCTAGSFLAQMFLENLSIYAVMLGVFLCGVHFARNKKVPMKNVLMLLGAAAGLLIMFSSRIYGSLWNTGETLGGYRSLSVGTQYSLMTTIYMLLSQAAVLAPLIFEKNPMQCLIILGLLSTLLLQKEQGKRYSYALCVVNGVFALYILHGCFRGNATAGFIPLAVNGAFFLTVAGETAFLLRRQKPAMGTALTIWFSVPGVILPLVFTLETGERLFFTSNVFLVLFAAMLFLELKDGVCLRRRSVLLLAGTLILVCFYGYIYFGIGTCKRERDALMAQATRENASSIVLPQYPHENYVWAPNPVGEKREGFFRTFYHLPENIEILIKH